MTKYDSTPARIVQIIQGAIKCPISVYVFPETLYEASKIKYQVRITVSNAASRMHCKRILKSLGMETFETISDTSTLRVHVFRTRIQEIWDEIVRPSHASKFEDKLTRLFKEAVFSSILTPTRIDYIAVVDDNNILPFLRVIDSMGIDDWEVVDNNKAIAFSISRISDSICAY